MAAFLVGTACGGGSGGGGSGGPPTVATLAGTLGCTQLEMATEESQGALGSIENGSCQLGGERVDLFTYDSDSEQERAIRILADFEQVLVVGEGWTARVDSTATAEIVKDKLGGSVS